MKLIAKAQEEDTREYILRFYLVDRARMDNDNFKTFNEYYEEMKPRSDITDNRSKDEIMNEILEIENKSRKEDENGAI